MAGVPAKKKGMAGVPEKKRNGRGSMQVSLHDSCALPRIITVFSFSGQSSLSERLLT